MKKTILSLLFISSLAFQGCTVREETHIEIVPLVFEVTTSFTAANNFAKLLTINPPIHSADMVLVYRLFNVVSGVDVWRTLPQTVYLTQGELDYNFEFTRSNINIFLDSNFDLNTLEATWALDQTFRIVIIPGYFANKSNDVVDFNDYKAVIKAFNVNENKIVSLKN